VDGLCRSFPSVYLVPQEAIEGGTAPALAARTRIRQCQRSPAASGPRAFNLAGCILLLNGLILFKPNIQIPLAVRHPSQPAATESRCLVALGAARQIPSIAASNLEAAGLR